MHYDPNAMFVFKFTDRDSYFAWIAKWKAEYAESVRAQRENKREFLKVRSKNTVTGATRTSKGVKTPNPNWDEDLAVRLRGAVRNLSDALTHMLRERAAAKKRSYELKQQRLAA
jgi:hypothetical protein